MWNDTQIRKAIIKNILISLFILFALFLVDNRAYLFHYLPNRSEYELKEAYIQPSNLRHNYVQIVMEQGEVVVTDTVKHGYGEMVGSVIIVGYASDRKPSVVRVSPVVTGGQICVSAALVLGNLGFVWRIRKASP